MPDSTPQVVIVCAWYNRADYIRTTVDSLLAQKFDSFEVVIVNDGSTDSRVKETLNSYSDPRLRVIHQNNAGFVKAIRRAIDESQAPYIAIQGAGDISLPDRLRRQYKVLSNSPSVGAVGSKSSLEIPEDDSFDLLKEGDDYQVSKCSLAKRVPFTHGTLMLSRKYYEDVGGYDVRMRMCSDWDLYTRLINVCEINVLGAFLYRRFAFSDGFTFSPGRKVEQRYFKSIAKELDQDIKEKRLANLRDFSKDDIKKARYLPVTFRYLMGSFKRGDRSNFLQWLNVASDQVISMIKLNW
ncbi:hypothetical protein BWR19_10140 [Halomonas sp. 1513]|nr:glycosyltransferase family A protein [Halomonas sp. 1513]APX93260.1 hypothetical protein BWR19_10140 [Halomonas sp. 1513]